MTNEVVRGFTPEQITQLLRPINSTRVLSDGKGFSHVSQQDILAHLTRIFGFGNFDIDVKNVELVFENERRDAKTGELNNRFDVCYKALVRLTIRDQHGNEICHFENGSLETSQNQTRGDGHDLAYKSAISLSVKRAAIALGDQFGLSLYNKGQKEALVRAVLVPSQGTQTTDVQEGVPQQVSLGNDEKEATVEAAQTIPNAKPAQVKPQEAKVNEETPGASVGLLKVALSIIHNATTLDQLRNVFTQNAQHLNQLFEPEPGKFTTLMEEIDVARARIGKEETPNV